MLNAKKPEKTNRYHHQRGLGVRFLDTPIKGVLVPWCSLLGYPYQGGSRALVFASWIPPSGVTSCLGSLLRYPHRGFSCLGVRFLDILMRGFSCLGVRFLDTPHGGFSSLGLLLGYSQSGGSRALVCFLDTGVSCLGVRFLDTPHGGFSCLGVRFLDILMRGFSCLARFLDTPHGGFSSLGLLLGYPESGGLVPWFASWIPPSGVLCLGVRFLGTPHGGFSCLGVRFLAIRLASRRADV